MADLGVDITHIDREQAFLLFATFCGDFEKTAHALSIPASTLIRMADEERWTDKLRPILELKRSNKPGDIERAINRAMNFVQAHRYRMILERVIKHMTAFTDDQLREELINQKKDKLGVDISMNVTTKSFADLAAALEKAHAMTYLALGDTSAERVKREAIKGDDGAGIGELHVRIAEAMREVGQSNTIRARLFDAQLQAASEVEQARAVKPIAREKPEDNDDH